MYCHDRALCGDHCGDSDALLAPELLRPADVFHALFLCSVDLLGAMKRAVDDGRGPASTSALEMSHVSVHSQTSLPPRTAARHHSNRTTSDESYALLP
jgi:hypothetical protein